jgi:hypothetical protein
MRSLPLIATTLQISVSFFYHYQCFAFVPMFTRSKRSHDGALLVSTAEQQVLESPSSIVLDGLPLEEDEMEVVRHYTEMAIAHRGEPRGLDALRILSERCQRRIPYDFNDESSAANKCHGRDGTVVAPFRQLLSPNTTKAFLEEVREMEGNGWLSTNPDSVDGLPSLHLNLVSHGKPLVPTIRDDDTTTEGLDDFQRGLQKLLKIVEHPIYTVLLPEVNRLVNSTTIKISDVFLRRYGQDVCGGEFTRNGIAAHYDVFSRVTAVIALDDVAAEGTNGLFTTYLSSESSDSEGLSLGTSSSSSSSSSSTSNHVAMRRFFPLQSGDGVVHTWDVLHGVDVELGLDRTSLVIWFTEGDDDDASAIAPSWLANHPKLDTDDVTQFVLASALSCDDHEGAGLLDPEESKRINEGLSEDELYLRSAAQGNAFALTRMGSLFEEESPSGDIMEEALKVLDRLRPTSSLPDPLLRHDLQIHGRKESTGMAMRFWLEGAVRGNPLAQTALADELILEASQSGDAGTRLLAAVLFALAAQQGIEEASESLSRVVDFDLASGQVQTEEFLSSPIVQTARA